MRAEHEDWRIPAAFFETHSLYRWFAYELPSEISEFRWIMPALNLECSICKQHRTFHEKNNRWLTSWRDKAAEFSGIMIGVEYECLTCTTFAYYFLLRSSEDRQRIMKVGQCPPWSINPEPVVAKALGTHLNDFKKGMINESQGYGIGAFAYYRRIVEVLINELLSDILTFIPGEKEHEEFRNRLEKVKDDIRADVRIDAVKDLVPVVLRPGEINPLSVLHSALSEGLHAHSDDECLEYAAHIRESLTFLIEQVRRTKENSKTYVASIRALQEKRSKRDGKIG